MGRFVKKAGEIKRTRFQYTAIRKVSDSFILKVHSYQLAGFHTYYREITLPFRSSTTLFCLFTTFRRICSICIKNMMIQNALKKTSQSYDLNCGLDFVS